VRKERKKTEAFQKEARGGGGYRGISKTTEKNCRASDPIPIQEQQNQKGGGGTQHRINAESKKGTVDQVSHAPYMGELQPI